MVDLNTCQYKSNKYHYFYKSNTISNTFCSILFLNLRNNPIHKDMVIPIFYLLKTYKINSFQDYFHTAYIQESILNINFITDQYNILAHIVNTFNLLDKTNRNLGIINTLSSLYFLYSLYYIHINYLYLYLLYIIYNYFNLNISSILYHILDNQNYGLKNTP